MISTNLIIKSSQLIGLVSLFWLSLIIPVQTQPIIGWQNNASERFFEQGHKELETEITLLEQNPRYWSEPVLEISQKSSPNYFSNLPQFIAVNYSHNLDLNSFTDYQFIVELPVNAEKNLEALTIVSGDNLSQINFKLDTLKVLVENQEIPVNSHLETTTDDLSVIKIVFDDSINPGNTILISLQGSHPANILNGFYTFGIWATPSGENPLDIYLGSRPVVFP